MNPSESRGKAATTETKRMYQTTPQSFPKKKKRKVDNTFEQAIDKLQTIANECKDPEDNEFDIFCKSLAYQLKKMPLERALVCQEKLQSVMTTERLHQIVSSAPSTSSAYITQTSSYSQSINSSSSSTHAPSYSPPSAPPFEQYNTISGRSSQLEDSSYQSPPYEDEQSSDIPSQDILTKALLNIM